MNYDCFYDAFKKILAECYELNEEICKLLDAHDQQKDNLARERLEVLRAKLSALHCFADALDDD